MVLHKVVIPKLAEIWFVLYMSPNSRSLIFAKIRDNCPFEDIRDLISTNKDANAKTRVGGMPLIAFALHHDRMDIAYYLLSEHNLAIKDSDLPILCKYIRKHPVSDISIFIATELAVYYIMGNQFRFIGTDLQPELIDVQALEGRLQYDLRLYGIPDDDFIGRLVKIGVDCPFLKYMSINVTTFIEGKLAACCNLSHCAEEALSNLLFLADKTQIIMTYTDAYACFLRYIGNPSDDDAVEDVRQTVYKQLDFFYYNSQYMPGEFLPWLSQRENAAYFVDMVTNICDIGDVERNTISKYVEILLYEIQNTLFYRSTMQELEPIFSFIGLNLRDKYPEHSYLTLG